MKIVLGLLIAVNLLAFLWINQTENHTDELAVERATNMPPLRLLSEKPSPQAKSKPVQVAVAPEVAKEIETAVVTKNIQPKSSSAQETAEPAANEELESKQAVTVEKRDENPMLSPIIVKKAQPSASFVDVSCYSLGPFSIEKALKSVASKLNELGVESIKRDETRRVLTGFWVYIPPLPSRADARKVVSMLKTRGVKDYLIVSNGVKKHAISLGFFRTREGAQQHKTHMQTLGLAPIMDESYKDFSGFWLDFTSSSKPALPNGLVNDLENQYDGISMKKRQCLK